MSFDIYAGTHHIASYDSQSKAEKAYWLLLAGDRLYGYHTEYIIEGTETGRPAARASSFKLARWAKEALKEAGLYDALP